MTRRLRVTVDHDLCVGNGTCLTIAPRVFEHDANRQSVARHPEAGTERELLDAARSCPVGAIALDLGRPAEGRGGDDIPD